MKPGHVAAPGAFVILLLCTLARADPPQPVASPSHRLGIYGEASTGFAVLHGERDGSCCTYTRLWSFRLALGGRLELPRGIEARLGAVLDVVVASVDSEDGGVALGVEVQVDRNIVSRWRLGPRLSLSNGIGGSSPSTSFDKSMVGTVGIRFLDSSMTFGIDAVRLWHREGYATGALINAGLGIRPRPKVVLAASALGAGVAIVVGIALVVALASGSTH